jgi:hypothetical protein
MPMYLLAFLLQRRCRYPAWYPTAPPDVREPPWSNRETRVTALNGHIRRVARSGNPWHNRRIYPSNLEADQWLAERHGAGRSNLPSPPGLARLNR